MPDQEQSTKSPTVIRAGETPVNRGITLTDKQRASGHKIYFTPPQEGVEVATAVKANSLEKAQELTGVSAPEDTPAPNDVDTPADEPAPNDPADEPADNTDERGTE